MAPDPGVPWLSASPPLRKRECLKKSRPDFFSPNEMRATEIQVGWTWPMFGRERFQDFFPLADTLFSLGLLGAFTAIYTSVALFL